MDPTKHLPSADLRPYVSHFWTLSSSSSDNVSHMRFIPDGYVDWVFHLKNPWEIKYNSSKRSFIADKFHLFGHSTSHIEVNIPREEMFVFGVKFQPWAAREIWKGSMHEFTDEQIGKGDLNDKDILRLESQLHEAKDIREMIALTERTIYTKISGSLPDDIFKVMTHMLNCPETLDIKDYSLSKRRLQQRFQDIVGVAPKVFQRTIRINRAINHLIHDRNVHLTRMALEMGFYDQSHLIREFKQFTSVSPRAFLKNTSPSGEFFQLEV